LGLLKKLIAIKNVPKAIAFAGKYGAFLENLEESSAKLISLCVKQDWQNEDWRNQLKESAVNMKDAANGILNLEQPDFGEEKSEDVLKADSLQETAMHHYQSAALKFIKLSETPKLDESSIVLYRLCVQDFTTGQEAFRSFNLHTKGMREKQTEKVK
jgi:hypothetical protein